MDQFKNRLSQSARSAVRAHRLSKDEFLAEASRLFDVQISKLERERAREANVGDEFVEHLRKVAA